MHVGVMLLVGLGYQGRRQLLVVGGKHSDGARGGGFRSPAGEKLDVKDRNGVAL